VSLLKKPFQALLFAEDKNAFSTFFQRITSWDAKQTLEVRFAKKDSSYFHAQVEGIGFSDAAGDTQQFLLAILDVTDRKRLEERLFQSEHRFRNLFNSMKEGFVLCEMIYNEAGKPVDFRFIEANPAFALQSGVPIESIPGKLVTEIISEIEPLWIETFGSVVESGQARSINYPIAELEKHYEVHAWRSGPGRFAAVFNDITLRVAAQDLLQHQTDELAVANKNWRLLATPFRTIFAIPCIRLSPAANSWPGMWKPDKIRERQSIISHVPPSACRKLLPICWPCRESPGRRFIMMTLI